MSFSFYNAKLRKYIHYFPQTMSSNQQVVYMTNKIREGYEAADVTMWQALLQQAKTESGDSVRFLFLILDMAQHNDCSVLDIVKTGRVCSSSKTIDQKFADALMHCMDTPDDDFEVTATGSIQRYPSAKVLDLTCDESSGSSQSYEETSEPYNDNPTSNEAYEIDGFVVPDHHSEPEEVDDLKRFGGAASSSTSMKKSSASVSRPDAESTTAKKKKSLKRRIIEDEEEQ